MHLYITANFIKRAAIRVTIHVSVQYGAYAIWYISKMSVYVCDNNIEAKMNSYLSTY